MNSRNPLKNNFEENFNCFYDDDTGCHVIAKTKDGKENWYKIYKEGAITIDQMMKIYDFMQQNSLNRVSVETSPVFVKGLRKIISDDKDVVINYGEKNINLSELPAYDNSKLKQALVKHMGATEKFYKNQQKKLDNQIKQEEHPSEISQKAKNFFNRLSKKLTLIHNHGGFVYDHVDIKNIDEIKAKFGSKPFEAMGLRDNFKSGPGFTSWKETRPIYRLDSKGEVSLLGGAVYSVTKGFDEYENHPASYSFTGFITPSAYRKREEQHNASSNKTKENKTSQAEM